MPLSSLQDSFYKSLSPAEIKEAAAGNYNFDHPDAIDVAEFMKVLETLKEGRSVDVPIYDFATHSRTAERRKVRACEHGMGNLPI